MKLNLVLLILVVLGLTGCAGTTGHWFSGSGMAPVRERAEKHELTEPERWANNHSLTLFDHSFP